MRNDGGTRTKREVKRFFTVGGKVEGKPSLGQDTDLETTRARLLDWALPQRMLAIASLEHEFDEGLLCLSLSGNDRGRIACYSPLDSSDSSTLPVAKSLSHFFDLLEKGSDGN
jgi:hypothetical protein